jgi:hypothetical protein
MTRLLVDEDHYAMALRNDKQKDRQPQKQLQAPSTSSGQTLRLALRFAQDDKGFSVGLCENKQLQMQKQRQMRGSSLRSE